MSDVMNEWTEVVALEEIPQLGSRVVRVGNEADTMKIAVFRTASDEVFAMKDECPHKQGPLSQGIVHGTSVTCPLHNWKIDLASGKALGPDEGCTNVFPTKVENGIVFIDLKVAAV
ncbi:Nitrite reductase [NAD(P)H] small subunit [hydrothermal vent metagenome]|uniref:Nitrite reductase [NAD(P)H] small subunit n=1 Tax=hydrothermal vent metagenome TaxID=652676 RepID=A0A3B0WNT6_9ZZZZ